MAHIRVGHSTFHCSTALGSLILLGCQVAPSYAYEEIRGNTTVIVDGSGDGSSGTKNSPWIVQGPIAVGVVAGDDAKLIMQNGGAVFDALGGSIGLEAGSKGAVAINGYGSSWITYSDVQVGVHGTGELTLSDGGNVDSGNSSIGAAADGTGTAVVTGQGSKWTNAEDLFVGNRGEGTLTINDRGLVDVEGSLTLGRGRGSAGTLNIGTAEGETAAAAGQLKAAKLEFGIGKSLLVFNHTDKNLVFDTAITGRGRIRHLSGTTTFSADSSRFAGDTSVVGGVINMTGQFDSGYVGIATTSGGEAVINVAGPDAELITRRNFAVGEYGKGTLVVSDGGTVSNDVHAFVGVASGSFGTANVRGAGSGWTVKNQLSIGYDGTGTLSVSDGAVVSSRQGSIGNHPEGTGSVTVDGTGSTWTNTADMTIGNGGNGSLTISNGGSVEVYGKLIIAREQGSAGRLNIGAAEGATAVAAGELMTEDLELGDGDATIVFNHTNSDYVLDSHITGNGQIRHLSGTTTLSGDNAIGDGDVIADGGELIITNGLESNSGSIGSAAGSSGAVSVTGPLADWQNSAALYVGEKGEGRLRVSNGGSVSNVVGSIGVVAGSGGSATVTGTGSSWTNSSALYVGYSGEGEIDIADGGSVTSTAGSIGATASGRGRASVSGAGSTWDTSGAFYVGYGGQGTLDVSDGGAVNSARGSISVGADSSGAATVRGAESRWTNTSAMYVGFGGRGTLEISDGGSVSNTVGSIGVVAGSDGAATVTGAGSSWENSDRLFVGYAGQGALSVLNGATVRSSSGAVGFHGTGSGRVEVTGAGSSWENTGAFYVGASGGGALTIADGGAVSNAGASVGNGRAANGAVLVTGAGSTWTNAGDLTLGNGGTGSLTLSDGGTVVVDGALTLAKEAGSTGILNIGGAARSAAAAAGALNARTLVFGQGTGTLNFNHRETGLDFDTDMSGQGTINQIYGVTNLTGDSSGFTGTTTIRGGSLFVNGSLGGATNVASGILGGTGSLDNVIVGPDGSLQPGNSVGALNVVSATFLKGSSFDVELNDGGYVAGTNNDILNASDTITIKGGEVNVRAENKTDNGFSYTPGTYTIIRAEGGITGTFDEVNDDYAYLDFSLGYDTNAVSLTSEMSVSSYCVAGMSYNQCAAGEGAYSLGDGNSLFSSVLLLSEQEAPAALDQISGEIHASSQTALLEDSRFLRDAVIGQTRVEPNDATIRRTSVWGQGVGAWSRWDSDGNAGSLERTVGGFILGSDLMVHENYRVGVLGGYSSSHFRAKSRASSGSATTYSVGAYAAANWDRFKVTGGVSHSWHSLETVRSVTFSGFSDKLAASYGAKTLQAWGEATYRFDLGRARLTPFAGLAYVRHATDGFNETGGAAALEVAAQSNDATFTTLGVRADADVQIGDTDVGLHGALGWKHAIGRAPGSQMRFASGGDAFSIAGVPLSQDAILLDLGVDVNLSKNMTLGITYDGAFASGTQTHSARLMFNMQF